MRLRNRQTKATFWTDGDLIRWHRDKREFYRSLWACAEDSCCIIDDMFELKFTAWASPMDADMTVDRFEEWRDELIECGKLVPYIVDGRRYFFIPTMSEHEKPRNPQPPDWPLPPYITCDVTGEGRNKRCTYTFRYSPGDRDASIHSGSGDRTASPVLTCPVLTREEDPLSGKPDAQASSKPPRANGSTGFAEFYDAYPRHEKRGDAEKAWKAAKDRPPLPDLLEAVSRYRASPKVAEGFVMLPATWLRSKSWLDEYGPSPMAGDYRVGVL